MVLMGMRVLLHGEMLQGVRGLLMWGASAADGGMRVQLMRCACTSAA